MVKAELAAEGGTSPLTQQDAEAAVLNVGEACTGERPSLAERLNRLFPEPRQVGKYLGRLQNYLKDTHDVAVKIATTSDSELTKIGKMPYVSVAAWLVELAAKKNA